METEAFVRLFGDGLEYDELRFPARGEHRAHGLRLSVTDGALALTNAGDAPRRVSFGVRYTVAPWSREDYLMIPAAVYDGNRFTLRKMSYPPIPCLPADRVPDCPPLIADIPHLSEAGEPSQLRLRAGDSAAPCVLLWRRAARTALLARYTLGAPCESGVTVTEPEGREALMLEFACPAIRLGGMYRFPELRTDAPTDDQPATLAPGDTLTLAVTVTEFPCGSMEALYEAWFGALWSTPAPAAPCELPLSEAYRLIQQKYDRENWYESGGYYSVGPRDGLYGYWQVGWVGGGICTAPLYQLGDAQTRARCDRNLDYLFGPAQASGGLFYGIRDDKRFYGDDFQNHADTSFHLLRKSADALYYGALQLLRRREAGEAPRAAWVNGLVRCADAFEAIWRRYGQLGQFVDVERNRILSGSTASAAIAPAGLALLAALTEDARYLRLAEEIGAWLYAGFTQKGYTNGGPGEILSCPDSESACGLMESLTTLYERTGDAAWLPRAVQAAYQYASWVMPYDYPFPATSEFGHLGLHSAGAVWANAQNKHGAPGACTGSASALYRLYLYTMDARLLRLLALTTRNITQYLSRADRPLHDYAGAPVPEGWMCERVSTSDWEGKEKIGGIFANPCWCEISCMLCYAELPGVSVDRRTREITCLDHVEAAWHGENALLLRNPCAYPATVAVRAHGGIPCPPVTQSLLADCAVLRLAPGEEALLPLDA